EGESGDFRFHLPAQLAVARDEEPGARYRGAYSRRQSHEIERGLLRFQACDHSDQRLVLADLELLSDLPSIRWIGEVSLRLDGDGQHDRGLLGAEQAGVDRFLLVRLGDGTECVSDPSRCTLESAVESMLPPWLERVEGEAVDRVNAELRSSCIGCPASDDPRFRAMGMHDHR